MLEIKAALVIVSLVAFLLSSAAFNGGRSGISAKIAGSALLALALFAAIAALCQ